MSLNSFWRAIYFSPLFALFKYGLPVLASGCQIRKACLINWVKTVVEVKVAIDRSPVSQIIVGVPNALSSQGAHSGSIILHLGYIDCEIVRIVVVH